LSEIPNPIFDLTNFLSSAAQALAGREDRMTADAKCAELEAERSNDMRGVTLSIASNVDVHKGCIHFHRQQY
jgi:hypothetical protein